MVITDKTYTVEEFHEIVAKSPECLIELIDGRVVEKVTTEEHGAIVANIVAELRSWKKANDIQGFYSVEASVEIPDDDKNHRRPDVSFRLSDEGISTKGALESMPDFCVEVRSPTNSPKELREKAEFFLEHGAKLVWIVHPRTRIVEVYLDEDNFDMYTDDNVLSGGEVLPGFEMRVNEIFEN